MGEFIWSQSDRTSDFKQWHLNFQDDALQLTLPSSKTDPFRRGVTLTIAAVDDEACV